MIDTTLIIIYNDADRNDEDRYGYEDDDNDVVGWEDNENEDGAAATIDKS